MSTDVQGARENEEGMLGLSALFVAGLFCSACGVRPAGEVRSGWVAVKLSELNSSDIRWLRHLRVSIGSGPRCRYASAVPGAPDVAS